MFVKMTVNLQNRHGKEKRCGKRRTKRPISAKLTAPNPDDAKASENIESNHVSQSTYGKQYLPSIFGSVVKTIIYTVITQNTLLK